MFALILLERSRASAACSRCARMAVPLGLVGLRCAIGIGGEGVAWVVVCRNIA